MRKQLLRSNLLCPFVSIRYRGILFGCRIHDRTPCQFLLALLLVHFVASFYAHRVCLFVLFNGTFAIRPTKISAGVHRCRMVFVRHCGNAHTALVYIYHVLQVKKRRDLWLLPTIQLLGPQKWCHTIRMAEIPRKGQTTQRTNGPSWKPFLVKTKVVRSVRKVWMIEFDYSVERPFFFFVYQPSNNFFSFVNLEIKIVFIKSLMLRSIHSNHSIHLAKWMNWRLILCMPSPLCGKNGVI